MKSSRFSLPRSVMLTRRTATVTISAPLSSTAARVSAKSLYFPVPTIKRDLNDLPPRSRVSLILGSCILVTANFVSSAADEVDYLDAVARLDDSRGIAGLGDNLAGDLDRDAALARVEALEQRDESKVAVDCIGIAVERDGWHCGSLSGDLIGHRKASGIKRAASLRGSGFGAARTPRLWLPYAGITRIRFEGFSDLELSVRFRTPPA